MTQKRYNEIPKRQKCINREEPYIGGAVDIIDDAKGKSQANVNADVDDSLANRYTKAETYSKTELDSMITTPEIAYKDYDTYADMVAETEHPAGAIYRVANYDGTQTVTNKYAEYSWDGTQYKLMAVRDHGIDDEPTAGSQNLVKSEGIKNQLNSTISCLYNKFGEKEKKPDNVLTGKFVNTLGTIVDNPNFNINVYSINPCEQYKFSGTFRSSINTPFISWADSEGNIIYVEPYTGSLEESVSYTDEQIYAPSNAVYLYQNVLLENSNTFNIKNCFPITFNGDFFIFKSKRISINGSIEDSVEGINATDYIPITGNDDIIIQSLWSTTIITPIAFYSKDKKFIQSINTGYIGSYDVNIAKENIPSDAAFIRCTSNNTKPPIIISGISLPSIIDEISNVEHNVGDILDNITEKKFETLAPYEIVDESYIKSDGTTSSNNKFSIYRYSINDGSTYAFSGVFPATVTIYFVFWADNNGNVIKTEPYKGSASSKVSYEDEIIIPPTGSKYLYLNVRNDFSYASNVKRLVGQEIIDVVDLKNDVDNLTNGNIKGLKLVVFDDSTFYIRVSIDDEHDGILAYGYRNRFNFYHNSFMMRYFYIGNKQDSDNDIMNSGNIHDLHDSISPVFTKSFGPLFSNHGLCTPKVIIPNHGLTITDVGSEWVDQNDYHYTIVNIDGNALYLMPVIYNKEDPGYEYREWTYYGSPYPTSITRNIAGGETLIVESSERFDYQIASLSDIKIYMDGLLVSAGTCYGSEIKVSYQQIGYNPIKINQWWPTPIYNDVMLTFDVTDVITGETGFLSLTEYRTFNNFYNYALKDFRNIMPMLPLSIQDDDVYIYIPKLKKAVTGIDFKEEFISNTINSHNTVQFYRNGNDLEDVDKMPDRVYSYLKNPNNNSILFGFAAGNSLINGESVDSLRNERIKQGSNFGSWYPSAGNKLYTYVIGDNIGEGNMLTPSYIGSYEGYMCWYKPNNNIQSFYYKTGDSYIVYIHTKSSHTKEGVTVPSFMNGLSVKSVIEKTDGINYITQTVINSKIYISSNNTYNYLVLKIA